VLGHGLERCALLGVISGELCASHRDAGGLAVSCFPAHGGAPRKLASFSAWGLPLAAGRDLLAAAMPGRISVYGSGPTKPVADGEPVVNALRVAGDWVYYSVPGALKRVSPSGQGGEIVRQVPRMSVMRMTANTTHLFWAEELPERELWRAPLSGGPAEKVAWLPDLAIGLAADDRFVYVGTQRAILQAPVGGGDVSERARAGKAPQLAVDERQLCWASYDSGQILCQPLENP